MGGQWLEKNQVLFIRLLPHLYSVSSKVFKLRPILHNFTKFEKFLHQNDSFKAENWLNYKEKASFLHIRTKSVEPIFQSAGPILQHVALEGTLHLHNICRS